MSSRVFGLGLRGSFTMIQLVTVESSGQRSQGKILGVIILVDSLAGTLGTVLISQLRTNMGTYLTPFISCHCGRGDCRDHRAFDQTRAFR